MVLKNLKCNVAFETRKNSKFSTKVDVSKDLLGFNCSNPEIIDPTVVGT